MYSSPTNPFSSSLSAISSPVFLSTYFTITLAGTSTSVSNVSSTVFVSSVSYKSIVPVTLFSITLWLASKSLNTTVIFLASSTLYGPFNSVFIWSIATVHVIVFDASSYIPPSKSVPSASTSIWYGK